MVEISKKRILSNLAKFVFSKVLLRRLLENLGISNLLNTRPPDRGIRELVFTWLPSDGLLSFCFFRFQRRITFNESLVLIEP
jgi:hypothetical protein